MWINEQEMSFIILKNSLMNSEILSFPRFDLPFVLAVDSSSKILVIYCSNVTLTKPTTKFKLLGLGQNI